MAKNYRVAAGKYIHASVCVYVYTPFKIETHTTKQREKKRKTYRENKTETFFFELVTCAAKRGAPRSGHKSAHI
jgi:hypothetical protein